MGRHPSRRHVSPDEVPVGRRIRARRRELGMTQADLASSEYTKSFISQLESGLADPSLDSLRFLSRRLQTSISMLAGDPADRLLAALEGLLRWGRERARSYDAAAARRVLETAVEMASAAGLEDHLADAHLLRADLEIAHGDLDRAEQILAQVGEPPAGGPPLAGRKVLTEGHLALRAGRPDAAAASFRDVLQHLGKGTRHPDLRARALLGLAAALQATGELAKARRRATAAQKVAARARLPELQGQAELRLGLVALAEKRHDDARRLLRSACAVLERTDDLAHYAEALIQLGRVALADGDADEALAAARQALGPAAVRRDAVITARASSVAGRALIRQKRDPEGLVAVHAAVLSLERLGAGEELAEAAEDLAGYYRAQGDLALAERYQALTRERSGEPANTRPRR